jgi:steroid delta-isomerase
MSNAPAVRALVAFFEGLCPEAVARFPEYYASDAYFKDPFNEVRGLEPIQRIFAHMFSQGRS